MGLIRNNGSHSDSSKGIAFSKQMLELGLQPIAEPAGLKSRFIVQDGQAGEKAARVQQLKNQKNAYRRVLKNLVAELEKIKALIQQVLPENAMENHDIQEIDKHIKSIKVYLQGDKKETYFNIKDQVNPIQHLADISNSSRFNVTKLAQAPDGKFSAGRSTYQEIKQLLDQQLSHIPKWYNVIDKAKYGHRKDIILPFELAKQALESVRKDVKYDYAFRAKTNSGIKLSESLEGIQTPNDLNERAPKKEWYQRKQPVSEKQIFEGKLNSLTQRTQELAALKSYREAAEDKDITLRNRGDVLRNHRKMVDLHQDIEAFLKQYGDKIPEEPRSTLQKQTTFFSLWTKRWMDPHFKIPYELSWGDKLGLWFDRTCVAAAGFFAATALVMTKTVILAPFAIFPAALSSVGLFPLIRTSLRGAYHGIRFKRQLQNAEFLELSVGWPVVATLGGTTFGFGMIASPMIHAHNGVEHVTGEVFADIANFNHTITFNALGIGGNGMFSVVLRYLHRALTTPPRDMRQLDKIATSYIDTVANLLLEDESAQTKARNQVIDLQHIQASKFHMELKLSWWQRLKNSFKKAPKPHKENEVDNQPKPQGVVSIHQINAEGYLYKKQAEVTRYQQETTKDTTVLAFQASENKRISNWSYGSAATLFSNHRELINEVVNMRNEYKNLTQANSLKERKDKLKQCIGKIEVIPDYKEKPKLKQLHKLINTELKNLNAVKTDLRAKDETLKSNHMRVFRVSA